jgi:hypothetical protein
MEKIEGQDNVKNYITRFYKDLFGQSQDNTMTLDESQTVDIPQVSQAENEFLTASFMEKEIWDTVFAMERNKAPRLDGFPAEFYQKFWDVIKVDLMQMFHDLHSETSPLFNLNFDVITLIPKVQEANRIQQYRPICLLNVSFKIFTKAATIRINSIVDHIVGPTQTTFMQGCNILERVITLHEIIHELHCKRQMGLFLKSSKRLTTKLDGLSYCKQCG